MRTILAGALLAVLSCLEAEAADPGSLPAYDSARVPYGEMWGEVDVYRQGRLRPARRVMGGPDYVGSAYGLGKPPFSGVGPRPDWGRSSDD
jgi:hypothetical protein